MNAIKLVHESEIGTAKIGGALVARPDEQEEWLQPVIDAIPVPVFIKDVTGVYTCVNQPFLDMAGMSREEVIGRNVLEVTSPEKAETYREQDLRLMSRGGTQVHETQVRSADGSTFDVVLHKNAIEDEEGRCIGILGTIVDVSERNRLKTQYQQAAWLLNERVKELNCIARVADAILNHGAAPARVIVETVKLIPPGFQFPAITNARIRLDNHTSETEKFGDSPWRLASDILSGGRIVGQIEVVLCGNPYEAPFDPASGRPVVFLPEEKPLVDQLAKALGAYHEAWHAKRETDRAVERLERAESQAAIGHWDYNLVNDDYYMSPTLKTLVGLQQTDTPPSKEQMHLRVHPSDRPRSTAAIEAAMAGKGPFKDRHRFIQPDGSYRWVEVDGRVDFDDSGKPVRFFGTMKDISDFMAHQEEVANFRERLDLAERSARVGRWEHDLVLDTLTFSPVFAEIAGVTASDEAVARNVVEARIHPDDHDRVMETFERFVAGEASYEIRHRFLHPDGTVRWVDSSGLLEHDPDGKPVLLFGIIVDITEKIAQQAAIRNSEALFHATFDQAAVGICHVSPDGRFLRVNEGACRIWGYSEQELLEIDFQKITVDEDREQGQRNVRDVLDGRIETFTMETRYRRKDGKVIWGRLTDSLVRDDDGQPVHFISIIEDITTEHEARRRVEAMSQRLEKSLQGAIRMLARAQEQGDPYTAGHQQRVSELAMAIGQRMGLLDEDLKDLGLGSMIHDIGKINVPTELLTKPGSLREAEFELIKTHSTAGFDIIRDSEMPQAIADIVRHHHERFDGTGYPDGLKGTAIPLLSRIVAVADTVEAVTSHRPYRPARGIETARSIIQEGRGTLFDPEIVDHCIAALDDGDVAWTSKD